jgi:nitroreductase
MNLESVMLRRKSKRAYLQKPVPEEALRRIMEKTRWAPSSSNNQPWRFIVVREPEALSRLHEALNRGNAWAKKAPILIAVVSREADDRVRKDDPAVKYYLFDTGLAVENLLLAAVEEGLMTHPMAGYKAGKAKEALNIPEEYSVLCLISLGYAGDISDLDPETRAKDEKLRTREKIAEIFSFDGWPGEW